MKPYAEHCVVCGCNEHDACVNEATGERCSWLEPGLCTFCADAGAELADDTPDENAPLVQLVSEGEANAYLAMARRGLA